MSIRITEDLVNEIDQAIHNWYDKAIDLKNVQEETRDLAILLTEKTQEESQLLRIERGAFDAVSGALERVTGETVGQAYIDQLMAREGVPASRGVTPVRDEEAVYPWESLPEEFDARFGTAPEEEVDERPGAVIEYE